MSEIDTTGWRPVVIGQGRGAKREWLLIGYAGPSRQGKVPIALIDGTDCGIASRGRAARLTLGVRANLAGLSRPATEDEIKRRMK